MRILLVVLIAVAVISIARPAAAVAVRWEFDNHTTNVNTDPDPDYNWDRTLATDGVSAMDEQSDPNEVGAGGQATPRADYYWENTTGTGEVRMMDTDNGGRNFMGTGQIGSLMDLNAGVAIKFRIKTDPDTYDTGGNVGIFIDNASTAHIAYGRDGIANNEYADSINLWLGWWDYGTPQIWLTDRGAHGLKDVTSTVDFSGAWTEWIVYGKRIGDEIAWDLSIGGVLQDQTEAAALDGSLHFWLGGEDSDDGSRVIIGSRQWNTDLGVNGTSYDYLDIGVPEPSSLLAFAGGMAGLVGFAIRRRR